MMGIAAHAGRDVERVIVGGIVCSSIAQARDARRVALYGNTSEGGYYQLAGVFH